MDVLFLFLPITLANIVVECCIEVAKVEIMDFFWDITGGAFSLLLLVTMSVVQFLLMECINLSKLRSISSCLMLFYKSCKGVFVQLFNDLFRLSCSFCHLIK